MTLCWHESCILMLVAVQPTSDDASFCELLY
ncbi:hypothetical protein Rcae01_04467 [Novipirellula caenicola]|uniref:Uncharacterized protein n=1 Tax=Novipirellula caenicola TaxID=1536901 RepID=A0ABP9VXQ9_9BACT